MSNPDEKVKKSGLSLDWLIGGVLTRIGETVDRVTGRGWNPSSSLATSKLTEKLCFLLDEEVRKSDSGGKFAPHIITLKMQWNKFSPDADEELLMLRDELHAAAIDHINDKRYHTYAPLQIEIKTDYFTEGVRLTGGFGKFGGDDEDAAVNVTLPNITIENIEGGSRVSIDLSDAEPVISESLPQYILKYEVNGKAFEKALDFSKAKRFTIGRGKENGIHIDHQSVSKVHGSLVLSPEGKLLVADTGSTNGTYVSGRRIAYGKAAEIEPGDRVRIGTIEVEIEAPAKATVETERVQDSASREPLPPTITSDPLVSTGDGIDKPQSSDGDTSGDSEQPIETGLDDRSSTKQNENQDGD